MSTTFSTIEGSRRTPKPAGPAYAWVIDAAGRRYVTDVVNHRVLVEEPDGGRWAFGRPGRNAGELNYPRGLALVPHGTTGAAQLFVCDSLNHRVQVFDERGVPQFAFGGHGTRPGQLAAPADITLVTPSLPGDGDAATSREPLLAVADQWNGRIEVFRLDGTFVATVGTRGPQPPARADVVPETGWPFFRLVPDPVLREPAHLAWEAPHLVVTCANGRRLRIDLALAMLPSYAAWRRQAPASERRRAQRYHAMLGARRRALPADVLADLLDERLQEAA